MLNDDLNKYKSQTIMSLKYCYPIINMAYYTIGSVTLHFRKNIYVNYYVKVLEFSVKMFEGIPIYIIYYIL